MRKEGKAVGSQTRWAVDCELIHKETEDVGAVDGNHEGPTSRFYDYPAILGVAAWQAFGEHLVCMGARTPNARQVAGASSR